MIAYRRRRRPLVLHRRPWSAIAALALLSPVAMSSCSADGGGEAPQVPTPSELTSALGEGEWAFHYQTAAMGGSWSRWWAFRPDGTTTRTTEAWVHDSRTGTSSYPVRVDAGTWTVLGGRRVEAVARGPAEPTLPNDVAPGATRTWRFAAAVYEAAPRLVTHPTPAMSGTERALATRAFVKGASGEWVDEHSVTVDGYPELDTHTRVTVSITPELSPESADEPCELDLTIDVTVGAESATAALSLPCTRVSDPVSGWYAAGSVADYIYRFNVIDDSGALDGRSQPVRDALYDATVLVLAMHTGQPDVAVHPKIDDEALGWYGLATEPAPTPQR
ncbi:MAG: hypothetical protein IV100_17645 [Myxococcales bacterium]|nr:hypothetical protein [Myxococcales bacterium]